LIKGHRVSLLAMGTRSLQGGGGGKQMGKSRVSQSASIDVKLALESAPDRIRTCDLWFRRPALYPTELRARVRGSKPPGETIVRV